jgi:hypothetical protein
MQVAAKLPVDAAGPDVNLFTPNGYKIRVGVEFDPAILKQLIISGQSL